MTLLFFLLLLPPIADWRSTDSTDHHDRVQRQLSVSSDSKLLDDDIREEMKYHSHVVMRPKKPPRPKSEVFLNKQDPHPRRKRFSAFGVSRVNWKATVNAFATHSINFNQFMHSLCLTVLYCWSFDIFLHIHTHTHTRVRNSHTQLRINRCILLGAFFLHLCAYNSQLVVAVLECSERIQLGANIENIFISLKFVLVGPFALALSVPNKEYI